MKGMLHLKLFTRLMNKEQKKIAEKKEDVYAKMGQLGVSPSHMLLYQDAIKKLKNN